MFEFYQRLLKDFLSVSVVVSCMLLLGINSAHASDKASRSTEMVVQPDFNFHSHKTIQLKIQVADDAKQELAQAIVRVYLATDALLTAPKSEMGQALLLTGRTNDNGWILRQLQVPVTVNELLVAVQAMGVEGPKLVQIPESGEVVVKF